MQTTLRTETLSFNNYRTWLLASLFIAGNIIMPQLFHTVRLGGPTWLPIYFFTLVGAWIGGWRTGLLTALASPVINSLVFGMPAVAMLPTIILKSSLLAGAAAYAGRHQMKATLATVALVILSYQLPGTLGEWALTGSADMALGDLTIGLPGLLLQLFGATAVINFIIDKTNA